MQGLQWYSWLRDCVTGWKVKALIPDVVSLKFFIDLIVQLHCCPGFDSAANRNEYQEYFLGVKGGRCVGLSTLPPSCANCVEIWELEPAGSHRAHPGLCRHMQ